MRATSLQALNYCVGLELIGPEDAKIPQIHRDDGDDRIHVRPVHTPTGVGERAPMRVCRVIPKVVDVRPAQPAEDPELLAYFCAAHAMTERGGKVGTQLVDVRGEGTRDWSVEVLQPEEALDPGRLFKCQHFLHPREIVRGLARGWSGLADAIEQHLQAFVAVPVASCDTFRTHAPLKTWCASPRPSWVSLEATMRVSDRSLEEVVGHRTGT